jgi:catechol 2,3-dioxygenase-like lactoylglutathione lyase family enzyme
MMRFYEEVVGLERLLSVGDPAHPTGALYAGLQLLAGEVAAASGGSLHQVGLGLDNIAAIQQHLRAHGVAPAVPLTERRPAGRRVRLLAFHDPEGNLVELIAAAPAV